MSCVYDTKVTGKTVCPHHVSYGGSRSVAPFILNFDTRSRRIIRIHVSAALPPEKGPWYPWGGGAQSRFRLTKQSASPGNRNAGPRSFSPLSVAYIDRAVPVVAVFVRSWHMYQ